MSEGSIEREKLMGLSALAIIIGTRGSVHTLVVLYSINVFLTFSSAQLGMCVHWWTTREENPEWVKKIAINGIGMVLTIGILISTLVIKFSEGGWVTLVISRL